MSELPQPDPNIKWIVYGSDICPFCNKAKEYLQNKNQKYTYIDITKYQDSRELLKKMTDGYRTIPVIYKNGKFIGGYSDLCELDINDK